MNPAFKHLEDKLRIADLSLLQWAGILSGAILAGLWAIVLSPFGGYITLGSAVYIGGIPAAVAFIAGSTEFDLWLQIRAFLAWRRSTGRFQPGPGTSACGYVLHPDPAEQRHQTRQSTPDLDLTQLWHSHS